MKKIHWLFGLIFFCSCLNSDDKKQQKFLNEDGVPIPTQKYVNDFTGEMLDQKEQDSLTKKLQAYKDSTSTEIAIICLPKLPENKSGSTWDIEELANTTFRLWGIGQKSKNNGILILVCFEDHKDRIEVGYGLEGAIPDIIANEILEEDVKPAFKNENYFDGLDQAITSIQKAAAGEYAAYREEQGAETKFWLLLLGGIALCGVLTIISWYIGVPLGAVFTALYWYHYYPDFWYAILAFILGALATFIIGLFVREGGELGGSGGGSFSFSGGSGGGGFSGGSSGGGGASGGW